MDNEITINGKTYILKSEQKTTIEMKYFELKDEKKIHEKLKKILNEEIECLQESDLTDDPLAAMDPANCCEIIAKTNKAKSILRRYVYKQYEFPKVPDLDYTEKNKNKNIAKAKYGVDYLKAVIDFFQVFPESSSVSISVHCDYPITIENDDFMAIIAPRVEND